MECKEIREMYKLMFAEYPDIVTVKDLQAMLGISRHAAYDLLGEGEISCIRLANAWVGGEPDQHRRRTTADRKT